MADTKQGVRLLLMPGGGSAQDISYLVQSVQWGGRNGSASRTMQATLLDYNGQGHDRADIDVERGDKCILAYRDAEGKLTEVFQGLIMRVSQDSGNTFDITAYDLGVYLANNKDTFVYEDTTATSVFSDVCGRFGIPTGSVAGTGHVIHELAKPKTTGWDAIGEALTQTYEATGQRFIPVAREGKMHLLERRAEIKQYLLEPVHNMSGYARDVSIENIRTRIKAFDKEDNVVGEAVDGALEAKIGRFQDIETADDEMTSGEIASMVQASLNEVNKPERTMSVECLGVPDVYTGIGVYVRIPALDVSASYYVESDTHKFANNIYTMNLDLAMTS